MTLGVGGSSQQNALDSLSNMTKQVSAISLGEYQSRVAMAQRLMKDKNIDALYLNAGTNLEYFTGLRWYASERLVGAVLLQDGTLTLIAPAFERGSLEQAAVVELDMLLWEEHEAPTDILLSFVADKAGVGTTLAIDESTAFALVSKLYKNTQNISLCDGALITAQCRMHKSTQELALIQTAMDMTLDVHKATASMLHEGITTAEVRAFIHEAHQKVGASGSYFCIVLFGQATAYPHGVNYEQTLHKDDWVLIDTGCKLHGYHSDITRTYAFGEASAEQRKFWNYEKSLQVTAFQAAKIGNPCGSVDDAVRVQLQNLNLASDYKLPGVPHRTGHGIGMDIHEWPYLVGSDKTPLAAGMCFSNEPMVIKPECFGVRLEDHFYMTELGPKWFTQPSGSLDDPFNLATV
ncbi:aminopeptidase P family protein [Glaciecola sp. MH2013]|uniref:M24 family metallopeptidase n=1 Tax=Glaciecola sp. MH2013 TaxID=2785524 RepID=UPI00189D5D0A|nr:Xaa-Pro peptidase family protein [Glaciecola sp. MH2013]MBF7073337.1 aminopeptidase P family protein [Glaciecola sp. MH2013]